MFLLGFRRKLTALALCKSIESAIQWFQIHHRITFATIQNPAVYLLGARVSIFATLVPRLRMIGYLIKGLHRSGQTKHLRVKRSCFLIHWLKNYVLVLFGVQWSH